MRRLLALLILALPGLASAAGTLIIPGSGGGRISNLGQIGDLGCGASDAMVWNGSAWVCQAVGVGAGDSAQVNGGAMTDLNILDTAGDGAITWTRDTVPAVDTVAGILANQAVSPVKMKNADFGDFTCAAGVCSVDNDALALGTKTTGKYVLNITATPPIACTGCDAESATGLLTFDATANVSPSGRWDFTSGKLNVWNLSGAPAGVDCDNSSEYGTLYIDGAAATNRGFYWCTSLGWYQIPDIAALANVSVDGTPRAAVNFADTFDIDFSFSAGDVLGSVKPNAVALTTDTTGNYVQSVSVSGALSCTGCTPGEPTTPAISITAGGVGGNELTNTAVTPGSYTCPATAVVDADGRITGMTNGSCGITSTTVGFLTDGGAATLSEGIGEGGKAQVMDNGDLQYTDGAATPQIKTVLHRDGAASFTANSIPAATGTGSEFIGSAATANAAGTITIPAGQTLSVASGATVGTSLDSPSNNASGGALTLKEDTDLGANVWAISLGATNLGGNFSITPGTDGKLSGSSLLTAATVTPTELSTASRVRQQCISIAAPTTATDKILFRAETASTVTGIDCVTTDGNTPITPQNGGANAAGVAVIEATMTCTTTNTTEAGGSIDSPALAAGDWVKLDVVAAVTTTGTVTLCVTFTPN